MVLVNTRDRVEEEERRMSGRIVEVFEEMKTQFIDFASTKPFQKNDGGGGIELLASIGFQEIQKILTEENQGAYMEGAEFFQQLGINIGLEQANKRAIQYAEERQQIIKPMQQHTVGKLNESLQQALREEITFEEYKKQVRDIYWLSKNRADLIAVNELGEAYSAGNQETAKALDRDGDLKKRWNTVGDKRVTRGCRHNASQGFVNLDWEYTSVDGIGKSTTERPTRFPGCRCTLDYDVQDI